ncbi:hypothetical protein BDV41DRAFT_93854 [Aspergillus transmontanensis]|uniref:Uncharacterized protein n=1 Tax=Aspergillus transmontanensis TaxID=1034304 RepID=A0A5N6W7F2_9EURO|nr:hypothetical protein BDV41DRAFT_93854 [Aspergillus transmontanensis]
MPRKVSAEQPPSIENTAKWRHDYRTLATLSRTNYRDPSTVTVWTDSSVPGPLANTHRGTQDLSTTANWPMVTREYDPSIQGDWPPPRVRLIDVLVGFIAIHRTCNERAQNWGYDFDSAGNVRPTRTPYGSPFLLRGPDGKAYIGVYRGYYVLFGTRLAVSNSWMLTKAFGGGGPREIHTGLASLINFDTGNYQVYVGGRWVPRSPQFNIIQYAEEKYLIYVESAGHVPPTEDQMVVDLEDEQDEQDIPQPPPPSPVAGSILSDSVGAQWRSGYRGPPKPIQSTKLWERPLNQTPIRLRAKSPVTAVQDCPMLIPSTNYLNLIDRWEDLKANHNLGVEELYGKDAVIAEKQRLIEFLQRDSEDEGDSEDVTGSVPGPSSGKYPTYKGPGLPPYRESIKRPTSPYPFVGEGNFEERDPVRPNPVRPNPTDNTDPTESDDMDVE